MNCIIFQKTKMNHQILLNSIKMINESKCIVNWIQDECLLKSSHTFFKNTLKQTTHGPVGYVYDRFEDIGTRISTKTNTYKLNCIFHSLFLSIFWKLNFLLLGYIVFPEKFILLKIQFMNSEIYSWKTINGIWNIFSTL